LMKLREVVEEVEEVEDKVWTKKKNQNHLQ